ncbi:G8 domain-containing protein [uncultured Roseobacter sp.]|uniref:G8 domain-containing protein n=1 Tax=uncultured Roseobacter sp. TaxID=114847 RepID=UPI002607EA2C|nr:G8 domain-containing protein [uncultured Roseobacter sp.]
MFSFLKWLYDTGGLSDFFQKLTEYFEATQEDASEDPPVDPAPIDPPPDTGGEDTPETPPEAGEDPVCEEHDQDPVTPPNEDGEDPAPPFTPPETGGGDDPQDPEMPPEEGHGDEPNDPETPPEDGHDDGPHDPETPPEDGHGDEPHDHGSDLPQTPEEIEAFVAEVRAGQDGHHHHDPGSPQGMEHMAALNLVSPADATHIAIGNGSWFDADNWYQGQIPDADARVVIPDGVHMTYDAVSDASLFTVRVDGHLEFAHDADSQMVIDTMVVSPSGTLTIGTEETPVQADVSVDIVFAGNGPIDTDWDPTLLSRGLIAHGETNIHGAEKDAHEKVIDDPMEGDTWVEFDSAPEGWEVGDTIVVAGTHYRGHDWNGVNGVDPFPSQDEVRTITDIQDGMVYFDDPLQHDHDAPRDDLSTSVANYSRNVTFSSEDGADAEIYARGHVMFMHNDDVDVRYAAFHDLGRTDKSESAQDASDINDISFDDNVKGRYPAHIHKAGVGDLEDPAILMGNAVFGSPGWGIVHHDSNAIVDGNATFDTFGAGYVAESGNETGVWSNNIAIYAEGNSWAAPKDGNDIANFDLGQTGDGFWFQGRMVESTDNIAASVNHGFVYMHRGFEEGLYTADSEVFAAPDAFFGDETVFLDHFPVLGFDGNETFAAKEGLHVVKSNPNQGHDLHSKFSDFTAWNVRSGAHFEYTSHYIIEDFDLIGEGPGVSYSSAQVGVDFGPNTTDMTLIGTQISGFDTGMDLFKWFTPNNPGTPDQFQHTIIDPTFENVNQEYENFNPAIDEIVNSADLPENVQPDLVLDPMTYREGWPDPGARIVEISGTKTDSLGQTSFPAGTDSYNMDMEDVLRVLETDGYYSTSGGENYFMVDLYFSDRITGDIYTENHPVMIDPNVPLGNQFTSYGDAIFNGVADLDGSESDPTQEAADLFAQLTDGQVVLAEDPPDPEEEELPEEATA